MIVRTAHLHGQPKPGHEPEFDALVMQDIVPLMMQFPGVRATRVLRAAKVEDDGPLLYLSFESVYDSQQAMEAAFQAPIRQELRARLQKIMALFDGHIFHITQQLLHDDPLKDFAAP